MSNNNDILDRIYVKNNSSWIIGEGLVNHVIKVHR